MPTAELTLGQRFANDVTCVVRQLCNAVDGGHSHVSILMRFDDCSVGMRRERVV